MSESTSCDIPISGTPVAMTVRVDRLRQTFGTREWVNRLDASDVEVHLVPENDDFAEHPDYRELNLALRFLGQEYARYFSVGTKFRLTLTPVSS